MSDDEEPADLMGLVERVAVRLAHEGAAHPVAAATALAARGHEGVDRARFATTHGIDPGRLAAAEAGEIPLNELPQTVLVIVADHPGLDLASIERLETELGRFSPVRPLSEDLSSRGSSPWRDDEERP